MALKLNRESFRNSMPDNIKEALIKIVQGHPALPASEKDFICDYLHNYEKIGHCNRMEVLDLIDEMELFRHSGTAVPRT